MKLAYLAVTVPLSALGAGSALISPENVPVEVDRMPTASVTAGHRYQLNVAGVETTCSVVLRDEKESGSSRLDLEPRCSGLAAELSDAHFWQKQQNGDLLFIADDGRTIAQFFQGDGVAYESLKPMAPIMMLNEL